MRTAAGAPQLPAGAAELLHSIDTGAVLGASRQLHVLGECLIEVVKASAQSTVDLATTVEALVEHVVSTRGASSQAVTNGLERMARPALGRTDRDAVDPERGDKLVESVQRFRAELDGWLASVRRYGRELLQGHRTVLAYDYSSTVAQVLGDVSELADGVTVFVPEARSLDGGRKYLADWRDLKVDVRLIPDAALGWALARCDVAVVGAETLSAEGGCYNTIGTALVAHETARNGIPFYVLSVLLKTDMQTLGGERPSPSLDFLDRLDVSARGLAMTVAGPFPDLDYTFPQDISGVVTETGVVAPAQIRGLASAEFGEPEGSNG